METASVTRYLRVLISKYFSSMPGSEVFIHHQKAIRGYDTVAFFRERKAVEGVKEITAEWRGATWYFCSEVSRDTFVISPEKYAPQFGGYCAHGIANGYKAHTEPSTWIIIDDKLYFSYSHKIKNKWLQNSKERIKKANQRWQKIKSIHKIKYPLP